ncbi:MAG: SUMF1/EgtB/PvdO family nonheme iron enzyme [bacterium]|nr:SUMF1/EgtB/PvdO family nonheme iron enzyme [bacterium]
MFTELLIGQLTKRATGSLIDASGRRFRRVFEDPERAQALERCSEAGIVALLQAVETGDEAELAHLGDVMREFFTSDEISPDLGRALAPLLRGHGLDLEELQELFEEAGYEAETLPGFDFDNAFNAFAGGFAAAALEQVLLRDEIQTHVLLSQLQLQKEMVELLRQLAGFLAGSRPGTVSVAAEQITAESLGGTQMVFAAPAPRTSALGDWESHYLRTLVSQCDPLDLSPIDETHPQGSRPGEEGGVRLSDVFTSLLLEGIQRQPEESVVDALAGRWEAGDRDRVDGEDREPQPITALEATAALPQLVVLGRPGGGKSTLVNHLTTQLAKRRLGLGDGDEDKLPGWPPEASPLPVRIILRHFASWLPEDAAADAGLVWDYLRHRLERDGCHAAFDALHALLTSEGGVVFFDGLDEVHEDDARRHRSLIRDAIREFSRPLEQCRVVVTCREYAYRADDAWRLPHEDFPAVSLAPFGDEQIRAFTATWYQVIGPAKGWDTERRQREAQQLAQAVTNWPHLRVLGESPLLLTLMAQIHGRDGYLPRDRADLYERTVNLLLAHWENRLVRDLRAGSTVEPDRVLRLDLRIDVLRSALEKVAFDAHERQERESERGESAADVPEDDLLHALDEHLGSLDRARQVVTYLQQRAGLLQAVDGRTYRFPHRTFQEYLAARHLLKQPEYDEMLRDRVRRDLAWWREVFLLAAGASRETPRLISDLVDQLIPVPPGESTVSPELAERARLAAQALEETRFVDRVEKERASGPGRFTAAFQRIQQWLHQALRPDGSLKPAQRAACGRSLAGLGDPRRHVTTLEDMQLCLVPAGSFWMGSEKGRESEKPLHLVEHLDHDYWIARYPVTVAQFERYVAASGNQPEGPDALRDAANTPVAWVSWHEAREFCSWLTEDWHRRGLLPSSWQIRLPSEAEWEKAARGGLQIPRRPEILPAGEALASGSASGVALIENLATQREYPWEGGFDQNRCNTWQSLINRRSAVGCFPAGASPYGCEELSGNVWEWTRSQRKAYPYDRADGRESAEGASRFLLRGGSFGFGGDFVRCSARYVGVPANRYDFVGFRLVFSPFSGP